MAKRPLSGIATDAAHSTKMRLTSYRGVDIATGEELFNVSLGNQTVNIGEFLGVIHAVKYILENNFPYDIIYTDSITAITWFENKKTASRINNAELKKAEVFLKVMESKIQHIQVKHWDNRLWGEIPADFGNK